MCVVSQTLKEKIRMKIVAESKSESADRIGEIERNKETVAKREK